MASEKLDVTATDSYIKEVGSDSIDTELQGRDFDVTPVDAARRGMLEVRLLNGDGKTKVTGLTEELLAEVHQPVVDHLLQHHPALLVGNYRHHLPIRVAQWRTFGLGLRVHICRLRRERGGLYNGRNGLHVCSARLPHACTPLTSLQGSRGWRAVSLDDEFRTLCTTILGLDSRYLAALSLSAMRPLTCV
jgi:hypothetical protein